MLNHFDTPVTLRKITRAQNENGYPIETTSETDVWGDLDSVKRSEFYAAEAVGHKLEYALTVPAVDWNEAEEVEINDAVYRVVRAYRKTLDYIELTLERY